MFPIQVQVQIVQALLVLSLQQPAVTVAVSVDPGADRHAISPLVYGVNFGDDAQAADLKWPVRRWGGNSTTRYSWQDDIANHASDWFFYNIESGPDPGTLDHALAVRTLPPYHADPFDRMLIAQAHCENLTLVTADSMIRAYDIRTLNAEA